MFGEKCFAACARSIDQTGCQCNGYITRPMSAFCNYHSLVLSESSKKFAQSTVFTSTFLGERGFGDLIAAQGKAFVRDFVVSFQSAFAMLHFYVSLSRPLTGQEFDLMPFLVTTSPKGSYTSQTLSGGTVSTDIDRLQGLSSYLTTEFVKSVGEGAGVKTIMVPMVKPGAGNCVADSDLCDPVVQFLAWPLDFLQAYVSVRQMNITIPLSSFALTGFVSAELSSNWTAYYDRCLPTECHYQETVRPTIAYAILTVLGLVGGSVATVRAVVSVCVDALDSAMLSYAKKNIVVDSGIGAGVYDLGSAAVGAVIGSDRLRSVLPN